MMEHIFLLLMERVIEAKDQILITAEEHLAQEAKNNKFIRFNIIKVIL